MYTQDRSGSPFVTPTFQSVLNRQLAKIMDAIDAGNLRAGYGMLKTLIATLNPKDSKKFMENDVAHIDAEIGEALKHKNIDLYQTRRIHVVSVNTILRKHLRTLFWKVMTRLHEGGYLEKQPVKPTRPSKSKMGVPKE